MDYAVVDRDAHGKLPVWSSRYVAQRVEAQRFPRQRSAPNRTRYPLRRRLPSAHLALTTGNYFFWGGQPLAPPPSGRAILVHQPYPLRGRRMSRGASEHVNQIGGSRHERVSCQRESTQMVAPKRSPRPAIAAAGDIQIALRLRHSRPSPPRVDKAAPHTGYFPGVLDLGHTWRSRRSSRNACIV